VRLLITGMGGELGTRVAQLLETDRDVSEIAGLDVDPPRRRLRRAEFHRINPRDRTRSVAFVRAFDPDVVVHLGIYEPNARTGPRSAAERTRAGSVSVLGAAAECPSLRSIVVRSGIEVYGRRRGCATVPDEDVARDPTSPFGASLAEVEDIAVSAGWAADVPVTMLRMAPVVGPHVPSPLGRYLRMAPIVPISAFADPTFSLLHQEDAVSAVIAAATATPYDGALNVVGSGAVTAFQAVRLGGRIPLPILGPELRLIRPVAELLGSPVPPHVLEVLHRGRTADGTLANEVLGIEPRSTVAVVKDLYEWATVTHLRAAQAA
jgi:UDP-glucose 4-epimerase